MDVAVNFAEILWVAIRTEILNMRSSSYRGLEVTKGLVGGPAANDHLNSAIRRRGERAQDVEAFAAADDPEPANAPWRSNGSLCRRRQFGAG